MTADVLFSLEAVTLTRAGRRVLEDLSLEIVEGATAVVGPSGAGKSTLLRLLNRLADPDHGTIRFRGRDLRGYDPLQLRQTVALVPQLPALLDGSPRTNIAFAAGLAGREPDVAELLRRAGLDPTFADRDVSRLSVGEQQRVMLSRALAQEPSVLLLDEPTSALDETSRDAIEHTLTQLRHTLGISLLLVTHDRAQAERLAQRTVQIDRGQIVPTEPQTATPARRP